MPKDVWYQLKASDQEAWDCLSDEAKRAILFAYSNSNKDSNIKANSNARKSPSRRVNMVDTDADELDHEADGGVEETNNDAQEDAEDESDFDRLVNMATSRSKSTDPLDIANVLSSSASSKSTDWKKVQQKRKKSLKIDTLVNNHTIHYRVTRVDRDVLSTLSLVDRGANGGVASDNVRVIETTDRRVNVSGVGDHELENLKIVTAGGVCPTKRGNIIVILHQYALIPGSQTIHSSHQMESFSQKVDDKAIACGGTQQIETLEGHVMPLDFLSRLPYLPLRPYTDREWETLPHVVLTSDADWDPTVADHILSKDDSWYQTPAPPLMEYQEMVPHDPIPVAVNWHLIADLGFLASEFDTTWDPNLDFRFEPRVTTLEVAMRRIRPVDRDYSRYRKYFLGASAERVAKTFEAMTQYARSGIIEGPITNTLRAPFPALNVRRRNKAVATDTIFSDVPSINGGYRAAQFFCGIDTKFSDIYGVQTDGDFISVLQDNIRRRGAMDTLVSDRAKAEISKRVKDLLRHLCIDKWQSEPHQHHQNPAERQYRLIKRATASAQHD